MKLKGVFIFICLILLLCHVVSASDFNDTSDSLITSVEDDFEKGNDKLTVDSSYFDENNTLHSDNSDVLGDSNVGSFKDLNTLVKGTNVGGTLVLDKNYVYNSSDGDFADGITISKSMTIDGNGFVIDGNNQVRAFTIIANNVTLKNIITNHTRGTDYAGCIEWDGDYGKILNSNFYNSELPSSAAYDLAGFINWRGDYGIVNNTVFDTGTLGAHYSNDGAGGINVYGANLIIDNCQFLNIRGYNAALCFTTASNECKVENSLIKNCRKTGTGMGGIVFVRRSQIPFINCQFINCYVPNGGEAFIWVRGATTLIDCYFKDNTCEACSLFYAATSIENCTVDGHSWLNSGNNFNYGALMYLSSDASVNNLKVYNLKSPSSGTITIIKNNQGSSYANSVTVTNSTFENFTGVRLVYVTNSKLLSFINCTFKNIYWAASGSNMIQLSLNTNKTTISDCKFLNVTGTRSLISIGFYKSDNNYKINANCGYANLVNNYYDDLTVNGQASSLIYNAVNKQFTKYSLLYAEPNGRGSGLSPDDRCSLSRAIGLIDAGGVIYLKAGYYDEFSDRKEVYASIIGEERGEVIINKGSFSFMSQYRDLINITFNNLQNTVNFGISDYNMINCSFENVAKSIQLITIDNGGRNNLYENITIKDSSFNLFLVVTNVEVNTFKNFVVERCTFTHFLRCGSYTANIHKNITIKDSTYNRFIDHTYNEMGPAYQNDLIEDIHIIDCTLKEVQIYTRNNAWNRNNVVRNFNVIGCEYTATGSTFIYAYYGYNFYNLNITDLDITPNVMTNMQIVRLNHDCGIYDSYFENFTMPLFIETQFDAGKGTVKNITAKDINCRVAVTALNNGAVFDELHFYNVSCTEYMGSLINNVQIKNSDFTKCFGDFKVQGNNVRILKSEFNMCRNNTLYGNGSCVELVSGDNLIISDCVFRDNLAYRGAVYIHNVSDSCYIIDCEFYRNNATDTTPGVGGGAIFVEPGIHYYVNPKTRTYLSDILKKNDLYDNSTLYFVDEVWVVWKDGSEWDYYGGDDEGDYDHPVTFARAYAIVSPYGIIHFKVPNGVFSYAVQWAEEITKPGITFEGNGTRLSKTGMIVTDASESTVLKNLIFENYTEDSVLVWEGDDGLIINCTFRDNGGDKIIYGGVLCAKAENLTIVNSSFIRNVANNDDGSYGGAVYCNNTILSLVNCTFKDNSVGGYGSHIYLDEGSSFIDIINCSFDNGGFTTYAGSGVYVLSTDHVSFINSTFSNNTGRDGGCIIVEHIISNLVIKYSNFTENVANQNGGVIAILGDSVNEFGFEGNVFINNRAENGGAIYIYKSSYYTLRNSEFYNNSASYGSAIYCGNDSNINIKDCSFACPKYDEINNIVPGYIYANKINLINNTLSFTDLNRTVSEANNNLDLEYNYKYFKDYDAPFQSGVSIDETLNIKGHSYRLDGSNLARVFIVSADNVDLSNLTFVDACVVSGNGGAVLWSGSDGSISDSFFINCSAVNAGSNWNYGGAVCVSGANMNITDCAFDSCVSNVGSALRINNGNSVITNCIFTNNNADQYDGAIWYDGTNSGNFVLSDCIFKNNNASRWGGALRVDSKGSINNCIFENNAVVYSHKTSSGEGNGYGGAIYLTGNGVSVTNSTFKGNYVDNLTNMCGGGIYASKAFTLSNCYFMNNSASNGSAIYYVSNSDLNIDSCTFANPRYYQTNNWLEGYIYSTHVINFNNITLSFTDLNHTIANSGDSLDLLFNYMFFNEFDQKFVSGVPISKDFTINGNSFILDGNHSARIFNVTSGNVELSNLTFINGNATLGGAIYVIGNITVLNSNFTNNSAVLGGAIFIESGYSNLTNCTFNNNTAANGSAIYIITSVNHWDNLDFISNIALNNATIYFKEDSTVYSNNLTFTDNVIPNGLHIVGENHIYSPVIYVNATRQGFGIIMSEPTSLTRAVDNILDNGVIIICSDYTLEAIIKLNNLTNVTVTGNHTLRRDKHLFILPNTIQYNTVI